LWPELGSRSTKLLNSVHCFITSLNFGASYSLAALAVTPLIMGMMIAIIIIIMIIGIIALNMLVQSVVCRG